MSRSNPTLTNPAQHFFEWKGGTGKLQWYNKEQEKNVEVRLPFEFLYLDSLNTITGYNKADESGFWSNEVKDIREEVLYVKTKKGPFEEGLYNNLTQTMKRGGKFAKSIYLAHKIGDEWVIGNFKAQGSALGAWFDFIKKHNVEKGKIILKPGAPAKTPNGQDYTPPTFEWVEANTSEDEIAQELDKELAKYLDHYLKAPKEDIYVENEDDIAAPATPEQIADFETRRDNATRSRQNREAAEEMEIAVDDMDTPIDLSEIPF